MQVRPGEKLLFAGEKKINHVLVSGGDHTPRPPLKAPLMAVLPSPPPLGRGAGSADVDLDQHCPQCGRRAFALKTRSSTALGERDGRVGISDEERKHCHNRGDRPGPARPRVR